MSRHPNIQSLTNSLIQSARANVRINWQQEAQLNVDFDLDRAQKRNGNDLAAEVAAALEIIKNEIVFTKAAAEA